jgi:hypothetical protein
VLYMHGVLALLNSIFHFRDLRVPPVDFGYCFSAFGAQLTELHLKYIKPSSAAFVSLGARVKRESSVVCLRSFQIEKKLKSYKGKFLVNVKEMH